MLHGLREAVCFPAALGWRDAEGRPCGAAGRLSSPGMQQRHGKGSPEGGRFKETPCAEMPAEGQPMVPGLPGAGIEGAGIAAALIAEAEHEQAAAPAGQQRSRWRDDFDIPDWSVELVQVGPAGHRQLTTTQGTAHECAAALLEMVSDLAVAEGHHGPDTPDWPEIDDHGPFLMDHYADHEPGWDALCPPQTDLRLRVKVVRPGGTPGHSADMIGAWYEIQEAGAQ